MSFEKVLGVHEPALHLQSRRAQVLAANIANADTPGYKARDIDFRVALQQVQGQGAGQAVQMLATSKRHLSPTDELGGDEVLYRQPLQASLDGNTVESHVEMAAFTENSMRYLMSLRFVGGKFKTLSMAIRGQ
ncbi:MAG: flagellar basal body rod protein FlgB [Gammaproteobacteria bacterium]